MDEQNVEKPVAASKKKKNWFMKHKVLTAIGVIIILVIIGSAMGGSKKNNSSAPAATSSPQPASSSSQKQSTAAQTATMGQAVRDGKFEFVVKSVDCGQTVVGPNQYLQKTAQGQFCLMTLTVKNIGDSQQYFSETDQKLLNSSGQQYSPDTTATLYNSNSSDALLAQINPGNTVQGVIVFDIPKDQKPVTAELHDSAFSGGVKVSLQ